LTLKKAGDIMERKDYFKKLVMLFEADEEEKISADPDIDLDTDTGADVKEDIEKKSDITDDELDSELKPEMQEDELEGDMLSDQSSLSDEEELPFGEETQVESADTVSEKIKLEKLFDLYRELIEYKRVFIDSLDNIDTNLLDNERNLKLINYKNKLIKLEEKLKVYITEVFHTEKYEKALYNYILLRTELITIVKLLRDVLNLNDSEEKPIQKEQETEKDEQI